MNLISKELKDGKFGVWATVTRLDSGMCVCVGGGTYSHIGSVVLALPRESIMGDGRVSCTLSMINVVGHKDDFVCLNVC